MKEHPIIFDGPMVRAIIAGRKTQTRRRLKPQPPEDCGSLIVGNYHPTLIDRHGEEQPGPETFGVFSEDGAWALRCPYGPPGDGLWVRETWSHDAPSLESCRRAHEDALPGVSYGPYYKATEIAPDTLRWRPSIHMPRWASRLTLEVTGVRIERVQEISEEDAWAEGVSAHPPSAVDGRVYRRPFNVLWDAIHGDGAWERNDWAWAIEFRQKEKP